MTSHASRHGNAIDVFLLLTDGTRVLLALRDGTGYADGLWNLPSGKLEAGEHALAALVRETREEIGLTLAESEPTLATVVHHRNAEEQPRLGLFFHVRHDPAVHGLPTNAEPHKCGGIDWFPYDELPVDTVSYTVAGVSAYRSGRSLVLDGWA